MKRDYLFRRFLLKLANSSRGRRKRSQSGSTSTNSIAGTVQLLEQRRLLTALPFLAVNNVVVVQGSTATFDIDLSQIVTSDVTVTYKTVDGSATTAAGDFTPTSGSATIAAGNTQATVTVATNADAAKPASAFFLELSNANGATIADGVGAATLLVSSPPSLSSSAFTSVGPASIGNDSITGDVVTGRVTGIAADPSNADTIYIASAGGGVWKTTDGGGTWTPLTDLQSTLAMGAIAIAPAIRTSFMREQVRRTICRTPKWARESLFLRMRARHGQ